MLKSFLSVLGLGGKKFDASSPETVVGDEPRQSRYADTAHSLGATLASLQEKTLLNVYFTRVYALLHGLEQEVSNEKADILLNKEKIPARLLVDMSKAKTKLHALESLIGVDVPHESLSTLVDSTMEVVIGPLLVEMGKPDWLWQFEKEALETKKALNMVK